MPKPVPPTRRLPQQPNLEQLRKQAKDLLEAYRAGDPQAIAEVEQFERSPDPKAFALNDAQRILARAYGHESWSKFKAFVDGVNVRELVDAVKASDVSKIRVLLNRRPELIGRDLAENNEHRALHYAVLNRDPDLVKLLMEAGADARKGIWPHRDATSALAIAREREYHEIVAVIEDEERLRREELSCPNSTISPVQDQINAAIYEDDTDAAIRLLESDGSLIQACDREGATPLHIAAQEANSELVAWLLNRRAKVNKRDIHELTPLDRAAVAADPRNENAEAFPAIARQLLERGAEMTIYAAVALGDETTARELLSHNPAWLRHMGRHGGLLSLAVNHGQLQMTTLLLDLGADVDERTLLNQLEEPTISWGMPLWCAALGNRFDIAKLLLDRGADPNANVYASGWPLLNAWSHEDPALKNLLLERGAKMQPYMVATTHNIAEAKRLLAANPSEDLIQELAWSAADNGCSAIVELALPLLQWPLTDFRWHWILIQPIRGATEDRPDREEHFRSMATILNRGINPNIARYGQTALHFAAGYRGSVRDEDRARFAGMLIDHGARLDLRDDLLKSTPLGWACRWGRHALAELLIARGAATEEPDAETWATPKAWARKMNQLEILALMPGI